MNDELGRPFEAWREADRIYPLLKMAMIPTEVVLTGIQRGVPTLLIEEELLAAYARGQRDAIVELLCRTRNSPDRAEEAATS